MKHKGDSIETTRCSKRKQKVKTIIEDKEKAIVPDITTSNNILCDNNVVDNPQETKIKESQSENLLQNSQVTHKSSENGESHNIESHKTNEPSQDIKQSSNESCVNTSDSDSNCKCSDTNSSDTQESIKEAGTEQHHRMPSPNSGKGPRKCQPISLSTITENIKGEEKEIKKSTKNQTKVQSDHRIDSHEVSNDKTFKQRCNGGTLVDMSTKKPHSSPSDTGIIEHMKEINRPTSSEKVLRPHTSLATSRNEKREARKSASSSRPSSAKSEPSSEPSSRNGKTEKSKRTNFGIRFTKKELEYYLPRKSTFSCHEKALKDAGFDLDTFETKRKKLRRRKPQIKNDDIDETLKQIEELNVAPEIKDNQEEGEHSAILEDEETEMERLKSKKKGKKKDEYEVKVDHTVLLQYLKYVLENRDEYLHHKRQNIQQNSAWLNVDPQCSIARFGRAFQRGQHGQMEETFLLEVAHSIKSNYGDGPVVLVQSKDKPGSALPPLKTDQQETTIDEKDKTEYEKVRLKLDKWLKTITTAQLIKAKELSLKELGEEDKLQTQWWSTLQPCRYLRQRTCLF